MKPPEEQIHAAADFVAHNVWKYDRPNPGAVTSARKLIDLVTDALEIVAPKVAGAVGDGAYLEFEPVVSHRTLGPLVNILVHRDADSELVTRGQLSVAEARTMALQLLAVAEAAEQDAMVFAELRAVGLDDNACAAFISSLRARRQDDPADPTRHQEDRPG